MAMAATLRLLSAALLSAAAFANENEDEPCPEFQCGGVNTGGACKPWHVVNDGVADCGTNDLTDENVATVLYCPRADETVSSSRATLTFRTDQGKDYATVEEQTKSVDARPCIFPFHFDSDGDGNLETYHECTKVCTDRVSTEHPDKTLQLRWLNPDINPVQSGYEPVAGIELDGTKQGCMERASGSHRQSSRAWCATEVDADGKVISASYCKDLCGLNEEAGPQQDQSLVDQWGEACDPYLKLPTLSVLPSQSALATEVAEAAEQQPWQDSAYFSLHWDFNGDYVCNTPGVVSRHGSINKDCDVSQQATSPKKNVNGWEKEVKLHLFRALTADTSSETIYAVTVYVQSSPQYPHKLPCDLNNPSCCEFVIRILDAEDPALLYPPFGPPQTLKRCADVSQCTQCQFEVEGPSASSDRVCQDFKDCGPCAYVDRDVVSAMGTDYSDRMCTALSFCDPSQNLYLSVHASVENDWRGCGTYKVSNVVCATMDVCGQEQYETVDVEASLTVDECAPSADTS
eukprot:SAG31_NODE_7261_length_1739_cov_1.179878_1_plen_516_part_01